MCEDDSFVYHERPTIFVNTQPHTQTHIYPKMKTAILATLVATAAAFAPGAKDAASTSTALNMGFESEVGAQAPLGFWDPMGCLNNASQEKFDRLRYVEIKHGRIAMLGVVGYLTNAAGIYLPGDIDYSGTKFSDLGYGWAASEAVPVAGALQVLAFIGMLELGVMKDQANGAAPGDFPGDFRNGAIDFGWDKYDEATKLRKRAIELNQGRAAQMGLLGLMVHEKLGNIETIVPPF